MNNPCRTSRGFTLIEIVLVLLIVGLLLAIVAPSLGGLARSQRMDQSARTIAAMLKQARIRASAEARPCRLVIDTEDNTCWLEDLTPEGFVKPESTAGKLIELDKNLLIELEGGETQDTRLMVRVEPDGTGEIVQVTLTREQDGKQLAVHCQSPTDPYTIAAPVSSAQLEEGW